MKKFQKVRSDRKSFDVNSNINTVNRSSLIVPVIDNTQIDVSFLNHFLIKRGIESVLFKITPYKGCGISTYSLSFEINDPVVYSYNLTELFSDLEDISSFECEFISTENIGVPYPAVIINHISDCSHNIVHSYSRQLNSIQEESQTQELLTPETNFDYINNKDFETFFVFQNGLFIDKSYELDIHVTSNTSVSKSQIKIDNLKPFNSCVVGLSDIINDISLPKSENIGEHKITVIQPQQRMFYGRLLAGIRSKNNANTFSANHSYYDTSYIEEYVDSNLAKRAYPLIPGKNLALLFYPSMSPSKGRIIVKVYEASTLSPIIIYEKLNDISNDIIYIDVANLLAEIDMRNTGICEVEFVPETLTGYKVPARINHQLIYSDFRSPLAASINVSLHHVNSIPITKKNYMTWIQILNNNKYKTCLAVCDSYIEHQEKVNPITLEFYSDKKLIKTKSMDLYSSKVINIDLDFIDQDCGKYIWVACKSSSPYINMYTVHTNFESYHTSGEHSF